MSVFIYVHRHPLRTYQEFFAKVIYLLIGAAMLIALLVTFTLWVRRVNNVFTSYWSPGEYELSGPVALLITPTSIPVPAIYNTKAMSWGGKNVALGVDGASAAFMMVAVTDLQNLVFATAWPAVVLSLLNKLLFRLNWWNIRYKGFIVRTNIILPVLEVFFHVWAIVAISRTFGPCEFVSDYFDYIQDHSKGEVGQVDHNFDHSFVPLLVVLCVNLGAIALGIARLAYDGCEPENARWAETRYVDFHRKAKKGVSGPLGEAANDDVVPPRAAVLRMLREYPDILREYEETMERRVDCNDNSLYTKDEFAEHYGGTQEWEAAPSVLNATGMTGITAMSTLHDAHSVHDLKYSPAIAPASPPDNQDFTANQIQMTNMRQDPPYDLSNTQNTFLSSIPPNPSEV